MTEFVSDHYENLANTSGLTFQSTAAEFSDHLVALPSWSIFAAQPDP